VATHAAGEDFSPDEERLIKIGAVQIYSAGIETVCSLDQIPGMVLTCSSLQTMCAMKTFVLCMLLNPSIQQRAQAEIDVVVGHDRLPTLADRSHLPYLDACLKESTRWAPVSTEGMAHLSRADDEYNGYFIPGGSIIIPSMW
jgi:hypothetical protein